MISRAFSNRTQSSSFTCLSSIILGSLLAG
jgi:hypothetical protein